jgi:hypothetical protein
VLFDARGAKHTATSAADGRFGIEGVTPPFDAVVLTPQAKGLAFYYAGLRSLRPRLEAFGSAGTPLDPERRATLRLAMDVPSCGAATCPFSLQVVGGGVSGGVSGGILPGSQTYDLAVSWRSAATTAVFGSLQVLVSNATYTSYHHASTGPRQVRDGETLQGVGLTPQQVALAGTLTVTTTAFSAPAGWRPLYMQGFLQYPAPGGFAYLARVDSSTLSMGIPNILGATVSVDAYLTDQEGDHQASASTGPLPLTTTTAALRLESPPTFTNPAVGQSLPRSGRIVWSDAVQGQVYTVQLDNVVGFSGGAAIDLSRLAAAGFEMKVGEQQLQLAGRGSVPSFDDYVDDARPARPDGKRATSVRRTVTITP